ncbi:hypothetical protein BDV19DRAFT_361356 [Aspergillus venezuelensis]
MGTRTTANAKTLIYPYTEPLFTHSPNHHTAAPSEQPPFSPAEGIPRIRGTSHHSPRLSTPRYSTLQVGSTCQDQPVKNQDSRPSRQPVRIIPVPHPLRGRHS